VKKKLVLFFYFLKGERYMDRVELEQLQQEIAAASAFVTGLRTEVGKVIVGQEEVLDSLILALLADGHVLLEGLPGLAKTMIVKSIAQAVNGSFSRIQFTPDLLPGDVTGTMIYNAADHSFAVRKGPVFANVVLADEINRAPAKVQSAMLECMQEKRVTIGGKTYDMALPFLVMATQNPIEHEGTYPLPEAQVDRFMFKLEVSYPSRDEERAVVKRMAHPELNMTVNPVATLADIEKARSLVDKVHVEEKIYDYILDLVIATRSEHRSELSDRQKGADLSRVTDWVQIGASPRASVALAIAAKAKAFMDGRAYVVPQDVKSIASDVLRHRVLLTYEAEAENISPNDVVTLILNEVKTP